MYEVDVLIPTARVVFSVEGDSAEVLPEHRSPQAFGEYRRLRDERRVVGMLTWPNTVLLRGSKTIVVDPGLPLQNEPVAKALAARGLAVADVDFVVLTHAHLDHAGACEELAAPVVVHERETRAPHWSHVVGMFDRSPLIRLSGASGEVVPGVRWALTPGHSVGHVSLAVETETGVVAICGDTIGPLREEFDAMAPAEGSAAASLLRSWRLLRAWQPTLVIAGHLPPFSL